MPGGVAAFDVMVLSDLGRLLAKEAPATGIRRGKDGKVRRSLGSLSCSVDEAISLNDAA
jgi:hypothetical protein